MARPTQRKVVNMLEKDEIQPLLPVGVSFIHAKTDKKKMSLVFFSEEKEENLYISCYFTKKNRWILDFDYSDFSNFEMIEQYSTICHTVKHVIENHSNFRLKFLTGSLVCTLSENVIADLTAYHHRCSFTYLEQCKPEILDFLDSISSHRSILHHTAPLYQTLYISGKDGYALGNFLESLSLLYIYPDKYRGGFILEFNDSITTPRVYQSERLECIADYLRSKGYSVFLS